MVYIRRHCWGSRSTDRSVVTHRLHQTIYISHFHSYEKCTSMHLCSRQPCPCSSTRHTVASVPCDPTALSPGNVQSRDEPRVSSDVDFTGQICSTIHLLHAESALFLFALKRHIAIDKNHLFKLGLNRGSHYELVAQYMFGKTHHSR